MINLNFDSNKVLQERLATSLGLHKYQYIMEHVMTTNVATNIDFQTKFNDFYRVRRNEEWRKPFYDYFEKAKYNTPTFEDIINYIYKYSSRVEASFSSKILATICPEKPIWDKYVLQNLDLKLKGKTKQEELKNAVYLYQQIENWYAEFLLTEKAKECIEIFNEALPNYKWLSDTKKVDTFLWSIR